MYADRVQLPDPVVLPVAIHYERHPNGVDIKAVARTKVDDITYTAEAWLMRDVLRMYHRPADIRGWLVSTANRAVNDVLTKVLTNYPNQPRLDGGLSIPVERAGVQSFEEIEP